MVDIEAALDETKKITGANVKSQVLAGHKDLTTGVHGVGAGTITSKTLTSKVINSVVRSTTSTTYVDIPNTTVILTTVVSCALLIPFAASLSHDTTGAKIVLYSTSDTGIYICYRANSTATDGEETTAGCTGHSQNEVAGDKSYVLRWLVSNGTGYTHYTHHNIVAIPL